MSAERKPDEVWSDHDVEDWSRASTNIAPSGDRIVTLMDGRGQIQTRLFAALVLESSVSPRPSGHIIGFKDGDRSNCSLDNLEWIPGPDLARANDARARAIATRERADAMRRSLAGRPHSDSAELLAEDRLR